MRGKAADLGFVWLVLGLAFLTAGIRRLSEDVVSSWSVWGPFVVSAVFLFLGTLESVRHRRDRGASSDPDEGPAA